MDVRDQGDALQRRSFRAGALAMSIGARLQRISGTQNDDSYQESQQERL